jgi:hypothetical protein
MNYTFQSVFAESIIGYAKFRKSQGFTTETSLCYLRRFDNYCAEANIESDSLSKAIVDSWFKHEQDAGYVDMCGRARIMRTYSKYLKVIGKEAYIIPSYLYRDKRTFVPYILSTIELAAFFEAADQLQSWHCGDPFVSAVAPVLFRLLYTSACVLRKPVLLKAQMSILRPEKS